MIPTLAEHMNDMSVHTQKQQIDVLDVSTKSAAENAQINVVDISKKNVAGGLMEF